MLITPTNKTAAFAGILTSLGDGPIKSWIATTTFAANVGQNVAGLLLVALFFFLPAAILVLGLQNGRFSTLWFLDAEERARYWIVAQRMLIWFFSAGITMAIVSLVPTGFG